jgi:hypothetical protein
VIVYLAGKSIAAVKFDGGAASRYSSYGSGEIKVGTLLNLFSTTFGESIENRKRFGKNGPLVKNGFIIIHSPRSYCPLRPDAFICYILECMWLLRRLYFPFDLDVQLL